MPKLKEPPFLDQPQTDNVFWSKSWREWLRDLWFRMKSTATVIGTPIANDAVKFNADGDLLDSGKAFPTGDIVGTTDTQTLTNKSADYFNITEDPINPHHAVNKEYADQSIENYVGSNALIENTVSEAGTEDGARFGSYRIGLFTDTDYAFFDEHGNLIFYGTDGVRLINPSNDTTTFSKMAVFDTDGWLKYRKLAEAASDLSGILATRQYASETFITDTPIPEPDTVMPGTIPGSFRIGYDESTNTEFDENGNIVCNQSTVDGRDVATDGAKLDTIESGAEVNEIEGDGTNGRVLRYGTVYIEDGTVAATIKCRLQSWWNGDTDGPTDNVAKGATTANYTLTGAGTTLSIEAAALSGNCLMATGAIGLNMSGAAGLTVYIYPTANDINIEFYDETGTAQDITTLTNTGPIRLMVLYMTSA